MSGGQALCMGGTSGLGKATAVELAKKGFNVTLIGRNVGRGEQAVSELEGAAANKSQQFEFVSADLFILANVKKICNDFAAKNGKLDVLVLSQGRGNLDSWTDNGEGLHTNMVVNYFGRITAAFELASLLDASDDPRVLTILGAGLHKPYPHFKEDFAVKEHFSLGNQADAGCSYTDCGFDKFATLHPKISTTHMAPGVVLTNWMLELPCYVKCMAYSCCGVCMCLCMPRPASVGSKTIKLLVDDEYKGGGYRTVGKDLEPVRKNWGEKGQGAEYSEPVWELTKAILVKNGLKAE